MHASTTEKPGEATLRRLREERAAIAARLFDVARGRPMPAPEAYVAPAEPVDSATLSRVRIAGDQS